MSEKKQMSLGNFFGLILLIVLWSWGLILLRQRERAANNIKPDLIPGQTPTLILTPTPEANWQRHTSQNLKIQFEYPRNWLLKENSQLIQLFNYFPDEAPERSYIPEIDGDLFKIEILIDNEFNYLDQWLENEFEQIELITGEPINILNQQELEIDGQKAFFYQSESILTGLTNGNLHIQTPDQQVLHIYAALNYPNYQNEFEEIYQSIRFID